jgi:general secretion pathway protein N
VSIISAALRTRERGQQARFARTGFAESTLAELAWQRVRGAGWRWAVTGAIIGAVGGLAAFAPAAWLASGVASATGGRLLLTDARGTLWNGSALPVLTGGPAPRCQRPARGSSGTWLGVARRRIARARRAACAAKCAR